MLQALALAVLLAGVPAGALAAVTVSAEVSNFDFTPIDLVS